MGENWGNRLSYCVEGSREIWRPVNRARDGSYVPKGWQALFCHPPRTHRKSPTFPSPPHRRDHRSSIGKQSSRLAPQGVGLGAPASQSSPVSVHPMPLDHRCAPRGPLYRVEDVSCSDRGLQAETAMTHRLHHVSHEAQRGARFASQRFIGAALSRSSPVVLLTLRLDHAPP